MNPSPDVCVGNRREEFKAPWTWPDFFPYLLLSEADPISRKIPFPYQGLSIVYFHVEFNSPQLAMNSKYSKIFHSPYPLAIINTKISEVRLLSAPISFSHFANDVYTDRVKVEALDPQLPGL